MLGIAVNEKSLLRAFLAVILIGGLILVSVIGFRTVQASTDISVTPTPSSVTEFTVVYADLSYDVPPTYGIDEFTGETVITQEGYHVNKKSAVFNIKNQPFNPYTDSSGNNISLYYNFRAKGHFGGEWRYNPFSENGYSTHRYSAMIYYIGSIPEFIASTSEYTELSVSLTDFYLSEDLKTGNQIDFQVQAQIGYIDSLGDGFYSFSGETSGWSETQTITIGENQTPTPSPAITPAPLPTSTPSQEPQQTEQPDIIIGVAIVVAVFAVGLGFLVYLIKRK
jgi:hypothetical protein